MPTAPRKAPTKRKTKREPTQPAWAKDFTPAGIECFHGPVTVTITRTFDTEEEADAFVAQLQAQGQFGTRRGDLVGPKRKAVSRKTAATRRGKT